MEQLSSAETAQRQNGSKAASDRQLSYVFQGYSIVRSDDGGFIVKEDRRVRNKHTGEYRDAAIETTITFTKKLHELLSADESVASDVIRRCDELRRTLDGNGGMKVFFDRKRDSVKVYAKWRYQLTGGKLRDERIYDVPPHVLELVCTNREYYRNEAYNEWHGPLLQRKREALISEALASEYPDDGIMPAAEQGHAKKEKGNSMMDVRTMTPKQAHATLKASASMLAEKFEPLFALPEQTEKYLSYVTDFARSTFQVSFGSNLPKPESDRIVRSVLLEKYVGDEAMLAALDRYLPEPAPAAEAAVPEASEASDVQDDDAEYMEVRDEELFSAELSAADEQTPDSVREADAAAAAEAEYARIRAALAAVADEEALAQHIVALENLVNPDNDPASRAAQLVLAEIELGRVGEVSEKRVSDLRRKPEERKLLASHPSLDARNVRIDENDQLVAFIDRQDIDGGVKRVMRRVTDAALAGTQVQDEELAERIANYLKEMLLAKNQSETTRMRFAQRLASYHVTDSEVHFKDMSALVTTVAGLAQKLRVKEKA